MAFFFALFFISSLYGVLKKFYGRLQQPFAKLRVAVRLLAPIWAFEKV